MLPYLYGILISTGGISLFVLAVNGICVLADRKYAHPNCINRIERLEKELFPHWFQYGVQYSYRGELSEISYYRNNPNNWGMPPIKNQERIIWEPKPKYSELALPKEAWGPISRSEFFV